MNIGFGPVSIIFRSFLFEGVSVTTVILAPGACGLGLRAALLATTSVAPDPPGAPAAPAAVFQKSPISCYLPYLRARGPLLISHPFFFDALYAELVRVTTLPC